ncbi:MAG: MBL fold metallo-hydrolase [Thermodesulfobacteriota bacterium]
MSTVKYGGNTPCIELRFSGLDRYIIVDAGSGLRGLGGYLAKHELRRGPITTELFLTHTHWDHIMGFPFFIPIFLPETSLKIYGPVSHETESLAEVVGGQMTYRYFPIRHDELKAHIEYISLKEEVRDLGGIKLKTKFLNHPVLCLGYRFEYRGKVFCAAYDNEPFQNLFITDPADPAYDEAMAREGAEVAREQNEALERFIAGADLLVHDCQYTRAEYDNGKKGWGHSWFEHVCELAGRNGVKSLALFHHDPDRTDAQLDELSEIYCKSGQYGDTEIFLAREGMAIEL